jgi:phospholipid-transporting ATPase
MHGRLAYRRLGVFICYYFYKNVILVFCEIYFAFENGYSGQVFFADWLPMLYNVIWTSWPCIFTFIFERDVEVDYAFKHPILYMAGPKKVYFNFKLFWTWILFAFLSGFVCYHFPVMGANGISD